MNIEKLPLQSADGAQINLDMLYQIAPSCFTEVQNSDGKLSKVVNFDILRQLLGDAAADTGEEFYQFTWPGKAEARREAGRPIKKTLRPVIEDSVDWDTTENLYIEGDNLEVLKLLQKSYMGKVKMIYIDPPYNTGNDFVYNDDFTMSVSEQDKAEGNVDELGKRYRKNPDSNGRFHSDWCSMIYPRLQIARSLLSEDGVIFLSIDDNEIDNLRKLCNEIFGEQNFIAQISWRRTDNQANIGNFARVKEYILVFSKTPNIELGKLPLTEKAKAEYRYSDEKGPFRRGILFHKTRGRHFYPVTTKSGNIINGPWMIKETEFKKLDEVGGIYWTSGGDEQPYSKIYLENSKGQIPNDFWGIEYGTNQRASLEVEAIFNSRYFDFPKPVSLIKSLVTLGSNKDSLVLDFFSGSATTAHAVMQLNSEDAGQRKFIMVQLPELTNEDSEARKAGYKNICEIGKERIRRAGKKIKDEAGLQGQDLDIGFRVFRVDESNMEDVYFQPAALRQEDLGSLFDNVKPGRTDLDLLFGAMLDWGVQLSLPMKKEAIDGKDIYTVNDGDLVACFAEDINDNIIANIAEKYPLRVLFRDSCFKSDADKINVFEQFKQKLGWSDEEAMKNIRVI